jgi:hypothetical protein
MRRVPTMPLPPVTRDVLVDALALFDVLAWGIVLLTSFRVFFALGRYNPLLQFYASLITLFFAFSFFNAIVAYTNSTFDYQMIDLVLSTTVAILVIHLLWRVK